MWFAEAEDNLEVPDYVPCIDEFSGPGPYPASFGKLVEEQGWPSISATQPRINGSIWFPSSIPIYSNSVPYVSSGSFGRLQRSQEACYGQRRHAIIKEEIDIVN